MLIPNGYIFSITANIKKRFIGGQAITLDGGHPTSFKKEQYLIITYVLKTNRICSKNKKAERCRYLMLGLDRKMRGDEYCQLEEILTKLIETFDENSCSSLSTLFEKNEHQYHSIHNSIPIMGIP
uniref:Uncharacterized protein n=1 Tax=Romanomermis culicivorax TaxID=13658 RepID=A0A915JLK1_ROMCU